MPTYIFWGNDQFRLSQAAQKLQKKVLDPTWLTFNFDKIDCSNDHEAGIAGLNQVVTPPLGTGGRLVWLMNPSLSKQQAQNFLSELERTLPVLNEDAHLLLTFSQKPDGRSKVFKNIEKQAHVQEFSQTPLWKTAEIRKIIHQQAKSVQLSLDDEMADYLIEALGNDTRAIQVSLEKIQLYIQGKQKQNLNASINLQTIQLLIPSSAQTSLDLANAVKAGETGQALGLLENLLAQNEAPLKILATLIRQFRTWMWIKMLSNTSLDNNAIAKAAEIRNPKRIYFLKKEIQSLSQQQLKESLFQLHNLELMLKQGYEAKAYMQSKLIKITAICRSNNSY